MASSFCRSVSAVVFREACRASASGEGCSSPFGRRVGLSWDCISPSLWPADCGSDGAWASPGLEGGISGSATDILGCSSMAGYGVWDPGSCGLAAVGVCDGAAVTSREGCWAGPSCVAWVVWEGDCKSVVAIGEGMVSPLGCWSWTAWVVWEGDCESPSLWPADCKSPGTLAAWVVCWAVCCSAFRSSAVECLKIGSCPTFRRASSMISPMWLTVLLMSEISCCICRVFSWMLAVSFQPRT